MTVHETEIAISYDGDGVSTEFIYPYRFDSAGDLQCEIERADGTSIVPEFLATGTMTGATIAITSEIPGPTDRITIFRTTEPVQVLNYDAGTFPSASHERTADKLVMLAQERRDVESRTLRLRPRLGPIAPIGEVAEGHALIRTALGFGEGPHTNEIAAAQGYAQQADQFRAAAEIAAEQARAYAARAVNVANFGAVGDGVADDAPAFRAAYEFLADHGGTIIVPAGQFRLAAEGADPLAGTAVTLTARHSNIALAAAGPATVRPASAYIEVFAQNGATGLTFDGVHFENPFGPLQGLPKGGVGNQPGENTGYTQNAAIRQRRGPGLRVQRCRFTDWTTAVHYVGDMDDNEVTAGDFVMDDNDFAGVVFGGLVDSPRTVRVWGNREVRGIDAELAEGSDPPRDPGHLLYLTDRGGAAPDSVTAGENHSEGRLSSPIKIRKGYNVSIYGSALHQCGRGIELSNCYGGTIEANMITMTPNANDSQQVGILATDCGPLTVIGDANTIDVSGVNGWGLRLEAGLSTQPWHNRGVTVGEVKVIDDVAASAGKSAIRVIDQIKPTIRGAQFIHTGTIQKDGFAYEINNCVDAVVQDIGFRETAGAGNAAKNVLRFRNNSTGRVRLDSALLDCGQRFDVLWLDETSTADFGIDGLAERVSDGNGELVRFSDGRQVVTIKDISGSLTLAAGETRSGTWPLSRPFNGATGSSIHFASANVRSTGTPGATANMARAVRAWAGLGGTVDELYWGLHALEAANDVRVDLRVEGWWK